MSNPALIPDPATYRRRTATARRITEARRELAAERRAEARRTHGISLGSPATRYAAEHALFPGFPELTPKYEADLAEAGTDTWGFLRTEAEAARQRDGLYRTLDRVTA